MWWCTLALAQAPAEDWKTVRTEHFRMHYPAPAGAWAEAAAGRVEALHARVVDEVGYLPPRVIDIVVRDPYATANGLALPFLGAPRMELWTSPPEATSVIGERRAWDELVLVHEDAHLAHLLRPSRNRIVRTFDAAFGWGPLARKAPAWVIEGYATVVEGRLTGSGRPHGAYRTAVLLALGRDGRLPAYAALDGSPGYLGSASRYLVGSAFLEWLEAEVGPEVGASEHALRDLWARMTARKVRSFDEAFRGVFRDPPAVLYARFRAEVEATAVLDDRGEDTLFLQRGWGTSRPTISDDGAQVAAVVSDRRRASALVVWSTSGDPAAEAKWEERVERVVSRDPGDVRPVRPVAFPPRELDRTTRRIGAPSEPVFEPGGSLLYAARTRDGSGRLRSDLYRWTPGAGGPKRLTRGADLRAPDPSPDGTWVAAVRSRWGVTEIVRLDLRSGRVTPIASTPGVDVDGPRVAPDGRVAWLENRGGGWVPVLDGAALWARGVIDLAWSPGGELLGVCAEADGLEACRVHPDPTVLTDHGAVLGVDVGAGDLLFFAALHADGVDLRTSAPVARPWDRRPSVPAPGLVPAAAVVAAPYRAGPMDLTPLLGGAFGASAATSELGVRIGDPVGRLELHALGALGDGGGVSGVGVGAAWRGLRPELQGAGWVIREALAPEWTAGGWVGARTEALAPAGGLGLEAGVAADASLAGGPPAAFGTVEAAWGALEPRRAALGTTGFARAQLGDDDGAFALLAGEGGLTLGRGWGADLRLGAGITSRARGFSVGGVDTGLVAAPHRWSVLVAPAFAPGTAGGRLYDHAELVGVTPWVAVFAERWRVGDALGPEGLTLAGLRVDASSLRQPLARYPAFETEFGIGLRIEDPARGWHLPGLDDLAAWGALQWRL